MTRCIRNIVGRPRAMIAVLVAIALATLTIFGTATSTSAADVAVGINNFTFTPPTMTIPVGTRVVWTNMQSGVPHTVTSDMPGIFDSGNLAPGATYAFTFNQPGTIPYHCNIHPNMHGTIIVTAAGQAPPPITAPGVTVPSVPVPPIAPPAVTVPLPPTPTPAPPAPPRTGGGGTADFIHRLGDG